MVLRIDIPPELERALSSEATELGLPLEEYARRLLTNGRVLVPAIKTGKELVAYWHATGVIGTRKRIKDSQGTRP